MPTDDPRGGRPDSSLVWSGTSGPTISQCVFCLHNRGTYPATCEAFPDQIPDAILDNSADHREPFPRDGGIRFSPKDAASGPAMAVMMDRAAAGFRAARREREARDAEAADDGPSSAG